MKKSQQGKDKRGHEEKMWRVVLSVDKEGACGFYQKGDSGNLPV
ncbi:hypothetical protein GGR08_000543 [Bartonella fuyuanensis]|uniref:Uncharacterized protein n=1 Tax=Bartonella fuyuanensis TaxID=1460968 RepID=A0A840DTF7_9HYPH|nr:hypothetical protein [Bartonella fuyuanensis]MBB4076250.1 hypothetical protein [Bartonella fuyuanensis]